MRIAAPFFLGLLLANQTAWAQEPKAATANETASADRAPGEPGADAPAVPGEPAEPAEAAEENPFAELESQLAYKTGDVVVGDKLATLRLGSSFRFLDASDTEKVLVAWGNPAGSGTGSLGMLFPAQMSPFDSDGWGVIVSYSEDGHVDDDDAKDTDFDELLADMKKDTEEANKEREKAGVGTAQLLGWAEPPHYDEKTHKLYWAKELDFGNPEHTLNYDIRVLGRKGVLELNAVASLGQLALIKQEMPKVLASVEFNQGMRYTDFDPGVDTMAAYGIGALVAGKVAAKAGLFKLIVAGLFASKKLLIAGVAAVGFALKKFFGKSSDSGQA